MSEYLANNVTTTLVNSISASATIVVVASADGFPVPNFRILIGSELMLVTAKSGTSFTVTRGVEGTTATSHSRTALVSQILTVQGLTNFIQENVLLSNGHMYANNVSQSVTIAVSGTMYRVPGSLTGGAVSDMTFQNSRELLVANAGTYAIQWAMSAVGGGDNEIISGSFMINNNGTGGVGASLLAANQATSTTSARPVCVSGSAVVSLSANDVIALCVTNRTNTDAVVVSYANLSIHKLD